jgi:hypothetical protein
MGYIELNLDPIFPQSSSIISYWRNLSSCRLLIIVGRLKESTWRTCTKVMEQYYVMMPESTSQNVLAVVTPNFWGHMTASSTSKIRPAYSIGPACSKLQNFTICFAAVYSRRLRSNFPRLPRAHHQKSRDSTLIRNLTQLATSCPRWQLKFQDSYPIFVWDYKSECGCIVCIDNVPATLHHAWRSTAKYRPILGKGWVAMHPILPFDQTPVNTPDLAESLRA